MNKQQLKSFLSEFKRLKEEGDAFLEPLPSYVKIFIFDNEYTNSISMQNNMLMQAAFGQTFAEELYWFIYDWEPGVEITLENQPYKINTIDDFINYLHYMGYIEE